MRRKSFGSIFKTYFLNEIKKPNKINNVFDISWSLLCFLILYTIKAIKDCMEKMSGVNQFLTHHPLTYIQKYILLSLRYLLNL